jgi:hypothetical protein
MAWFGGSYSGPKEVKYLFIDGGCLNVSLNKLASKYAGGSGLDLDYGRLTQGYSKVFYYDALPGRKSDEEDSAYALRIAPQRSLFDHLSTLDRFHVYEGDVRRSSSRRGPEQKKIDVMIAVDMLTHSFRRNMHEATLLTGDLDFKPLIDALVQEGMFVTLWYPPDATARELISAADRSTPLNINAIHHALIGSGPAPFILPKVHGEPSKGDYAPILTTWLDDGLEAKLMKDGDNFVAAIAQRQSGHMTYYEHSDLKILRLFMMDVYGIAVPEISA